MSDGKDNEYMNMVNSFKAQCEDLWGKTQKNRADLFSTTKQQFDKMQAEYSKGNKTMLDSMQKNYDDMKKQLKEKYDKFKEEHGGTLEGQFSKFTDGCKLLLSNFSASTKSAYDEAVNNLTAKRKSTAEEGEKKYNELVEEMDKNFEETKKKLTSAPSNTKTVKPKK